MDHREKMIPEAFRNIIHFVVELFEAGQFRSLFNVNLMATNVFDIKLDGRLVDFSMQAAYQVKALLGWVWDETLVENPEGADIITCHRNGALEDVVGFTDGVDEDKSSNEASQFAAVRISVANGAWDDVDTNGAVEWGGSFDHKG